MDCLCDLPPPTPFYTALQSFCTEKSLPFYFLHFKVLYKAPFSKFILNLSLLHHFPTKFLIFPVSALQHSYGSVLLNHFHNNRYTYSYFLVLSVSISRKKCNHYLLPTSPSTAQLLRLNLPLHYKA